MYFLKIFACGGVPVKSCWKLTPFVVKLNTTYHIIKLNNYTRNGWKPQLILADNDFPRSWRHKPARCPWGDITSWGHFFEFILEHKTNSMKPWYLYSTIFSLFSIRPFKSLIFHVQHLWVQFKFHLFISGTFPCSVGGNLYWPLKFRLPITKVKSSQFSHLHWFRKSSGLPQTEGTKEGFVLPVSQIFPLNLQGQLTHFWSTHHERNPIVRKVGI